MERAKEQRPAYFIGIALPPELETAVSALKSRLFDETDNALKPLVPHITLLHPSSLHDIPKEDMVNEIRKVAPSVFPLDIELDTIGSFGRSVLYVHARSKELECLESLMVHLLPPDQQKPYLMRGYTPHVTLVQVREPYSLDIDTLQNRVCDEISLPTEFTANSISHFTQVRTREYSVNII